MGLTATNHDIHTGMIGRIMGRFEKGLSETRRNMKAQHDSWQRFHQTSAGRHIPRRAWMRHGAMLEQISKRSD